MSVKIPRIRKITNNEALDRITCPGIVESYQTKETRDYLGHVVRGGKIRNNNSVYNEGKHRKGKDQGRQSGELTILKDTYNQISGITRAISIMLIADLRNGDSV